MGPSAAKRLGELAKACRLAEGISKCWKIIVSATDDTFRSLNLFLSSEGDKETGRAREEGTAVRGKGGGRRLDRC